MADLTAQNTNPTVFFLDGSSSSWGRIRGNSASDLSIYNCTGPGTYSQSLEVGLTTNTSYRDVDINNSSPKLTFTDTTGGSVPYSFESDGSKLTLKENTTAVLEMNTTEVKSTSDVKISKATPKLTFDNSSGTDFSVEVSASTLLIKAASTTVAQADATLFYANAGLAAGSTSSAQAIRWEHVTGALGASPFSVPLTFSRDGKIIGASVMCTTGSNGQNDNTFNLYDFLDPTNPSNQNFFVTIGRNPSSGTDTLTITYGSAYTSGSSLFHVLVFYEPV